MYKRKLLIALALLSSTLLIACGGEDKKVVTQEPKEEKEKIEEVVPEPVKFKSLLTNEETEDDRTNIRPLAVMIENTEAAQPHYGLCDAGVIYEVTAEGGITRYMALFDDYENYERLGNVRSARPYYIYLACEYDSILCHFGESDEAKNIFASGIIDDINGMTSGPTFFRSNDKKAPHNAYIASSGLLEEIENKGYSRYYTNGETGHFVFAEDENTLEFGEEATKIGLYYNNNKPYFEYNPDTKLYKRYAFGEEEKDALSDDGILVTNIIIQDVDSYVTDEIGHLSVSLVGSGTGKFFTRGKYVDISWSKDSNTGRTVYYMPTGEEIELNTGKTFICLVDNAQKSRNTIEPVKEPESTEE